jgi:hypothetical protein
VLCGELSWFENIHSALRNSEHGRGQEARPRAPLHLFPRGRVTRSDGLMPACFSFSLISSRSRRLSPTMPTLLFTNETPHAVNVALRVDGRVVAAENDLPANGGWVHFRFDEPTALSSVDLRLDDGAASRYDHGNAGTYAKAGLLQLGGAYARSASGVALGLGGVLLGTVGLVGALAAQLPAVSNVIEQAGELRRKGQSGPSHPLALGHEF